MSPPPTPPRIAWLIVALLFPVALLNYLDRQMLATMKSSMVGDIPSIANREDWGWVLGWFKWTYAILSPFGGYIADRVSKRLVIGCSLFAWSAITCSPYTTTVVSGVIPSPPMTSCNSATERSFQVG